METKIYEKHPTLSCYKIPQCGNETTLFLERMKIRRKPQTVKQETFINILIFFLIFLILYLLLCVLYTTKPRYF